MIKNKKILLTCFILLASQSSFIHAGFYGFGQAGIYGSGKGNNFFNNIFDNEDHLRATGRIGGGYFWDSANCYQWGFAQPSDC